MKQENKDWLTGEATEALDAWARRHRKAWLLDGADPTEIRSDLEAHLWRSLKDGQDLVTLETVEEAIAEMGLPELPNAPSSPIPYQAPAAGSEKKRRFWRDTLPFFIKSPFFHGIWPLLVVLFELTTGTLAGMFFDPMSRPSQSVLVLSVAGLGLFGFITSRQHWTSPAVVTLRGIGAIVAGYFSILALPVILVGSLAYAYGVILSIGVALLAVPIFLLCAFAAAAPLFLLYGFLRKPELARAKTSWTLGFLVGIGILLIVEGPSYVTRYGVAQDKVSLVRNLGSEKTLHLMCYEGSVGRRNYTDTSGFLTNGRFLGILGSTRFRTQADFEKRREFYYRVTGRSADSDQSTSNILSGRRRGSQELTWDPNLGGDGVAARIAGLSLDTSRIDGHLDSASRLGYGEWTMEFKNTGHREQEARMQLLLPNDGVVSRLTLWVNDEPEEAAFSATAKVTEAYKAIAVQQRRDPVLVRWVGADRIMAQCFPVPAQGRMKIRIGVTAPFDQKNRLYLPRIIEKNFGISEDLKTNIWIQGDMEMELDGLETKGALGKWREAHGSLSALNLLNRHTHVQAYPGEQPASIWTEDQFADSDYRVLIRSQFDKPLKGSAPESIIIVIDGSNYFEEWAEATDQSIADLRNLGHNVTVLVAIGEEVLDDVKKLTNLNFVGGQNCIPALESAFNQAGKIQNAKVLWLHGEQPIRFHNAERIVQLLERGFRQSNFGTIDLAGGPNRLLEDMAKVIPLSGSARPASPADLSIEIQQLISKPEEHFTWVRGSTNTIPTNSAKVWDQLARWQTWQTIKGASLQKTNRDQLAKLAAKYQLVTPVSGAVVLETKEQYKQYGLEQVDIETTPTVPGIPEPSTALLSFFSIFLIWQRRRKLP
ncbi:hypothetical protein N9A94_01670 [Akkermansiaceae bacterium]|nr:hypothetical protein [Akkermansiaceae bacterium]MDB4537436.1 hypothetical protein [Akkermansiaceae bacterium]MDB4544534.1 hypothetical protein [Akkermansiaceae bacterium]